MHNLSSVVTNFGDSLGNNLVKQIREERLMSKAELARSANVSPLTIDRIEKGESSRMDTKRKIILALGCDLAEKQKIFPDD
jgi:DNA-binding XRE family transcriptional regulator